jgi:hypothetical protein
VSLMPDLWRAGAAALLLSMALGSVHAQELDAIPEAPAAAESEPVRASAPVRLDEGLPQEAQLQSQLETLWKDPNLPGMRKEKTLRMKPREHDPEKKKHKADEDSGSWAWLMELARWINEAGRLLVWALGAVAVALLVVGLRYWIKVRGDQRAPPAQRLPSHVRDLDIRPESLPDRIGSAAQALWAQGEHRAALSLLYRGLLSRLVHDHAVPIKASSTEGDCLRLAAGCLEADRRAYVERLVQAWLLAVYGQRMPDDAVVQALCEGFDTALASSPASTREKAVNP